MYKEYDQMKNQYEIEINTMQQAMQRASKVSFLVAAPMTRKIARLLTGVTPRKPKLQKLFTMSLRGRLTNGIT